MRLVRKRGNPRQNRRFCDIDTPPCAMGGNDRTHTYHSPPSRQTSTMLVHAVCTHSLNICQRPHPQHQRSSMLDIRPVSLMRHTECSAASISVLWLQDAYGPLLKPFDVHHFCFAIPRYNSRYLASLCSYSFLYSTNHEKLCPLCGIYAAIMFGFFIMRQCLSICAPARVP